MTKASSNTQLEQDMDIDTLGFPVGYFIVKSAATDKVLEVCMDEIDDGTEIILHAEKEKSLVEKFRDPRTNNQVFFIDTSGALCSRSTGHAIDIEGDRLVIRHRRPISHPFPNDYAHPLPKFSYDGKTGEITVRFSCDPTYPPPGGPPSNVWRQKTYLLTAIPQRRPRTILDDASDFIASNIFGPISYLTGGPPLSPARPDQVFGGEIDLNEDELVEEDRGEEAEVDDAPEASRKVRTVAVPTQDRDMLDGLLSEKARQRRKWIVTPLRRLSARTAS